MADAVPDWAKDPAEAVPDWAKEPEAPSVVGRMGEAALETAKAGVEHATLPPLPSKIPTSWSEAGEAANALLARTPIPAAIPTRFGSVGEVLGQVARPALRVLSPVTTTVGALTSGLVGSPVQQLVAWDVVNQRRARGERVTPEEEEKIYKEVAPVGEIASALTPLPGRLPIPKFLNIPREAKEAALAGKVIEQHATDPAKVREALASKPREIVPESPVSTYQLTEDPGLGQLEATAKNRDAAAFDKLRIAQNDARLKAIREAQVAGSPRDVAQHIRDSMNYENSVAERAITLTEQRAFEAQQRLGPAYDSTTMGDRFRRELEMAEQVARGRERAMWNQVNPNGDLLADPNSIQRLERQIYGPGRMTQAAEAGITPAETQIANIVQNYQSIIPFQELTDLRSLVSQAMREERMRPGGGPQSPSFQRLLQFRQGIEEAIGGTVYDGVQAAARNVVDPAIAAAARQRVQAASAATRERAETHNPLRDVTRSEMAGGPYKMGVSSVPGSIVRTGPKGYDRTSQYFRAVGNERGMSEVTDELTRLMRLHATENGQIIPGKFQTFMRNYGETLRAVTERDGGAFEQALRDAAQAQANIGRARAGRDIIAERYASHDIRALTGAADDTQITGIIGSALGGQDAVPVMRDLARRLTTPEAQEGARRAVFDHVLSKFVGNAARGEENAISANKFLSFMANPNTVAALREILHPEQVTQLLAVAQDIRRSSRNVNVAAGSPTMQYAEQAAKRDAIVGAAAKMAIKAVAHAALPGVPGKGIVIEAASGLNKLRKRGRALRIDNMVNKAMADPNEAARLLTAANEPLPRRVDVPAQAAIIAGRPGAIAGDKNDQSQPTAPRKSGGAVSPVGSKGAAARGQAHAASQGARLPGAGAVAQAKRKVRKFRFADGGEIDWGDPEPVDEAQQAQEAREAAAERTRRGVIPENQPWYKGRKQEGELQSTLLAPVRGLAQGAQEALESAGTLQRTGDVYNPAPVVRQTLGAVGAPAIGPAVSGPVLGAGAVRRAAKPPPRTFPEYAEQYPPVGAPVLMTDPKKGTQYLGKELSPEAEEFKAARDVIRKDMQRGYQPYYDPAKRTYADPKQYPANVDTTTIVPKKQATIDKDLETIGASETRKRLREAFKQGNALGNANDWYAMGQLEKDFIKELGPKAGREAFKQRFATSMAATTGGADPTSNLLMAGYGNYLRTHGLPYPRAAYEMPFPIGGRYATGNMAQHQKIFEAGGFPALGEANPKRHNFAQNFMGNRGVATIDEQMTQGMTPGLGMPPPGKYGLYEQVLGQEAKRAGVQPANFQDVAWAGFKGEPGKPMISHVNDAIERTHRLTGMPREEIVRRGLVRGEIPIYTPGAVPLPTTDE